MQRYFVNDKKEDIFIIGKEDSHHITNVMRMKINDEVEIVYDNKLYIAKVIELDGNVRCQIVKEVLEEKRKKPKIIIAQALVKEQKFDLIIQKACELGVDEIIPLNTERSIVKYTDKDEKKYLRWNKILKEASEQSKRIDIPKLGNIMNIKELINVQADVKLVCSTIEKEKTIKSVLSKANISDTIIFVIGSEGGISKNEENFLIDNGYKAITFGDNILRTETASSFILSVVNYEFER